MFNRPVVPLVHSAGVADLPQPVSFEPPIPGEGEWLNTSIYVYRPDGPLSAGTEYEARVTAGLTDLTGGVLVEDHTWRFSSEAPRITWHRPPDGETLVGLTESISVTFNQPMDRERTQAAFRIETDSAAQPSGRFTWSEQDTVMSWQSTRELALDTHYSWSISADARSAAGDAPLDSTLISEFWTVPYPALLYTSPGDGETRASPYGGLDLYFASPMHLASVMPNLSIIPEPTSVYTWWDRWDNRYYVGFDKLPSTAYTVTIGGEMTDPYGNRLGQETIVRFATGPLEPMAYLHTPGALGTYNAYTQTVVYAVYRNVSELNLKLALLDRSDLVTLTGPASWSEWDDYSPPASRVIRRWTVPVESQLDATLVWRVPMVDESGNQLPPGIYYLEMTSPGFSDWQVSKHILVISTINLTVKAITGETGELLVWATDLLSGQPVADLPIWVVDHHNSRVASGTTSSDGLYVSDYRASTESSWLYVTSAGVGERGFSVGSTAWSQGISTWDFNLRFEDYGRLSTMVYLYTDRPIYRPGQTVYYKGILRQPDEARYRLPEQSEIEIEVYDWDDTLIYRETLPVTPMGTFSGEVMLGAEAKTGNYRFVVDPDDLREWVFFQVAEYRKPEFQVNVTPSREQLVVGEEIAADVEASYFFGGPVADAEVNWALFADDHFFQWDGPGRYSFADYEDWYWYWWDGGSAYGFGELIAEGSGVTDKVGKYNLNRPADMGDRVGAQLVTLEATVVDVNEQRVTGRTSMIVHPADRYAGIYADRYVGTTGEPQTINLIAVDLEGAPLPQAEVTMVALLREWYNVQVKEDGRTRWEWIVEETPVFTETVSMGSDGRAQTSFVPLDGGSYRLRAIIRDDAGRENRASVFLWVSSTSYVSWRMENNDRIELIADRDAYRPGDVAEILIPSPYRGEVTALVTVERGRFFQQEVITLRSNSEVYHLLITAEHAPTVFVSVVLIKGIDETNLLSSFKMGAVQLNVSPEQQQLTVELTPENDTFAPGDTVAYDIPVTDHAGNPVQAELSLALVDLSVLSLAADQAPPILDAFYGERGLGVETGIGLTLNVDRLNEQVADLAKGGGGGGDEAALGIGIEVRAEFPDTAYWEAIVQTDADGHAHVEIPLPDNLTTWRLSSKAVTEDTRVGQASTDIIATKALLVRPVAPRFFVVGDRVQLGAVVHNNTETAFGAEVRLAAQGVELAADSPSVQSVNLSAGGRAQVTWNVTVLDVPYVDLIFGASGGGLTDATKPTLATGPDGTIPVYRYRTPDVVGTAGQLIDAGSRTEGILLPPGVDATQGALQVEIAPSLAAAMQDGLTYLEHFSYECTEQTVSRFLPNVLTYRALSDLGIRDPEMEARLAEQVGQGLQRLYNQQHYDGGWGWWYTSESNALVTAWVLLGLDKAAEAGFPVDRQVLNDAAEYLQDEVQPANRLDQPWQANRQAFVLYVLAERGETTVSHLEGLFAEKDKLSHYARAYLGLAYGLLEGSSSDRLDTLLADIAGEAIVSATGAPLGGERARLVELEHGHPLHSRHPRPVGPVRPRERPRSQRCPLVDDRPHGRSLGDDPGNRLVPHRADRLDGRHGRVAGRL